MAYHVALDQLREGCLKLLELKQSGSICQVDFDSQSNGFLIALESACRAVDAPVIPRHYQDKWTCNYRHHFAQHGRYNAHILQACMRDGLPEIWLNGMEFNHSCESVTTGKLLRQLVLDLCEKSHDWGSELAGLSKSSVFRSVLADIDQAWAAFEKAFIGDLIIFEQRARELLVRASRQERHVSDLESQGVVRGVSDEQICLLNYLIELHSATGLGDSRGRSGAFFEKQVVQSAVEILKKAEDILGIEGKASHLSASRLLASGILDSFRRVRWYLSSVMSHLAYVNPELRKNRGLVERLTKWAECWEAGARYLLQAEWRLAMDSVVAGLRRVGKLSPAFVDMYETQDAELFLVVPRLVWLLFLQIPEKVTHLMQCLLPHGSIGDQDLTILIAKFRKITASLDPGMHDSKDCSNSQAFHIFAVYAVGNDSECDAIKEFLDIETRNAVTKLMRDLEAWSMELQRHCPTEWNHCSSILVRCLAGDMEDQEVCKGGECDFYV